MGVIIFFSSSSILALACPQCAESIRLSNKIISSNLPAVFQGWGVRDVNSLKTGLRSAVLESHGSQSDRLHFPRVSGVSQNSVCFNPNSEVMLAPNDDSHLLEKKPLRISRKNHMPKHFIWDSLLRALFFLFWVRGRNHGHFDHWSCAVSRRGWTCWMRQQQLNPGAKENKL